MKLAPIFPVLLLLAWVGCGGGGGGGSPGPLDITTTALGGGTAGNAYSKTLKASGGSKPYIWSLSSGSLPTGLSLGASGVISGTLLNSGTFNFTVEVEDNNTDTDTQALSIVVSPPPALGITTVGLPDGKVGFAYSQSVQASGGITPYNFAVISGMLPDGLSMDTDGLISGTPTTEEAQTFTVQVTDNNSDTDSVILTLTIQQLTATLSSIQTNIFDVSCAKSGCHLGAGAQEGLRLDSTTNSYNSLVNVLSQQDSSYFRVEPGDADDSWLIIKLEGTDPDFQSRRMPRDGPPYLDSSEVNIIRSWINNGALNN